MKLISGLIATALGHGRMMEPPSRSSYRHLPDDPNIAPFWDLVVPNWQDNELFCGGFGVQVSQIRISLISYIMMISEKFQNLGFFGKMIATMIARVNFWIFTDSPYL